jgi:uncharacterized protein YbaR (Trm112 family)
MLEIFDLLQCPYCAPKNTLELIPLEQTKTDVGTRINQGLIYCSSCSRFYMIKDEIVFLSQDYLRDKDDEMSFLRTWQDKIEDRILYAAKPYNLDFSS